MRCKEVLDISQLPRLTRCTDWRYDLCTRVQRRAPRCRHVTRHCFRLFKSPLHQMTQTTPTCLWNDSASIDELTYSIEHGAVGATCNPVIASRC